MKYKICPSCGKHNEPYEYECVDCGIDITNVNPTDEANESVAPKPLTEPVMVRICESCGYHNPVNAGQCQQCQEDLAGVMPTPEDAAQPQPAQPCHAMLVSLDEQYSFEFPEGETAVGRYEAMSEYLRNKPFVSRRHAAFRWSAGKLTVTNLSHLNYTFVNNRLCPADTVELHDGDIIGLGGNERNGTRQDDAAYFLVRICTCM